MEVTEQYCGLRTCNNQNNEYQKQEAKHVIHLVRPIKEFSKTIKVCDQLRANIISSYAVISPSSHIFPFLSRYLVVWPYTTDLLSS